MSGSAYFSIDKARLSANAYELKRRLCVSEDFDVSLYRKAVRAVISQSTPRACFARVPVFTDKGLVTFPFATLESGDLSKNLSGCNEAFVFAVTLGHGADRLLSRISRLSAADFFVYDAIGSALAESACDEAQSIIAGSIACKPRFSPGYGDFSLDVQKSLLRFIDAERLCGITLTDTRLMLPQKSITAVAGIEN